MPQAEHVLDHRRTLALDSDAAARVERLRRRMPEMRAAQVLRAAVRLGLELLERDPSRIACAPEVP